MTSKDPFHAKQAKFILEATKKYNLAHGSVSSGKTVCTLFSFLQQVMLCPGNSIFLMGNSISTIYRNVVALIFDTPEFEFIRPYCVWKKSPPPSLFIGQKEIKCIGCSDEGALGLIQGLTIDLCYCDEMTLYPENVIDMIDSRLRREHSKLYASMNPKQPEHKLKKWIDRAELGDPEYYSLHFTIDDNTFLPPSYKENLRKNISGLFYKRNFLGLWCMAEGAIFDFFDKQIHVSPHDLSGSEYFIAGIDYGTSNPFACVLIAVSTGQATQTGKSMRVIKEYYWNPAVTNRQKTNTEYMRDLQIFFGNYPLRGIYIDPSAAAFKLELRKAGYHPVDADNDVTEGIQTMANLMSQGILSIRSCCQNLIREIEGYVWDSKKSKTGQDAPMKINDHAVDSCRYAVHTHKVAHFTPEGGNPQAPRGQWRMV